LNLKKALKHGEKIGADEVEVYYASNKSISINLKKDQIDLARESISRGIGVRAIVNGAIGFSSTNDFNNEKIEEAVEKAVKSAKVQNPDNDWSGFPTREALKEVKGIYDENIENIKLDLAIEYASEIIRGATSVSKIVTPTSGNFVCTCSNQLILNTNGLEIEEKGTGVHAFLDVIAKNKEVSTAYEYDISRNLDLNFYEIGTKASKLALKSLNGIKLESKKTTVLLKPLAFADLYSHAFIPSLKADNVQKGRSVLMGQINKPIANKELSIIDDGLLENGIGTARTDDEGSPSQRTPIIENGILKTYIYDQYTAGKDKVKSTGNAVRNSYSTTPSIDIRNMIIEYPNSDIISETKSGIIINSVIGAHTANPVSGDFSVEARNAFIIKNGEIDKPIKSLMLFGNAFDLLKKINGAGEDIRTVGNIITPTIRLESMQVIG